MDRDRSPLERAADAFLYAPVGLVLQLRKELPDLAEAGRQRLAAPLGAARVVGELAVRQARRNVEERLHQAMTGPRPSGPTSTGDPERTTPPDPAGPRTAPATSTPSGASEPSTAAAPAVEDLAIPRYGSLSASQVTAHLSALTADQLAAVEAYERAHRGRKTILGRIEQLRNAP